MKLIINLTTVLLSFLISLSRKVLQGINVAKSVPQHHFWKQCIVTGLMAKIEHFWGGGVKVVCDGHLKKLGR